MYKITRVALVAACLFLLVSGAVAQKLGERYTDQPTGVSFQVPFGWKPSQKDDGNWVVWGETSNGFTSNINVKSEVSQLSLDSFVQASVDHLLKNREQLGTESTVLVSKTPFMTTSNSPGYRLIYLSVFRGWTIRSTQYVFSSGERKYTVTFTALDFLKTTNDPLFDASMKTFKSTK